MRTRLVKTTVKARNLELSERLRSQIDRKLRRLDRIAHPDAEATVELIAREPFDGPIALKIGDARRTIGPTLAAQVLVTKLPATKRSRGR